MKSPLSTTSGTTTTTISSSSNKTSTPQVLESQLKIYDFNEFEKNPNNSFNFEKKQNLSTKPTSTSVVDDKYCLASPPATFTDKQQQRNINKLQTVSKTASKIKSNQKKLFNLHTFFKELFNSVEKKAFLYYLVIRYRPSYFPPAIKKRSV